MKQTIEEFETRGVPTLYHSLITPLHRATKRDRWERRQAKIAQRTVSTVARKLSVEDVEKTEGREDSQPSVF